MISSLPLRVILAIFVAAWAVVSVLNGDPVSIASFGPFRTAAGVAAGLVLAFERWGWKHCPSWLVGVPNLEGTWKGQIISDYEGKDGTRVDPIDAFLVIRQTFSTISVRQLTSESSSRLQDGRYTRDGDGMRTVSGIYLNTPDVLIQDRGSRMHYGSMILEVHGDPPVSLEGHYWTDRNTKGRVTFKGWNRTRFDSFASASNATYD